MEKFKVSPKFVPKDTFTCPICNYPQYCGCPNCIDKLPTGMLTYKIVNDELVCSNCGFSKQIGWWEREIERQFCERVKSNMEIVEV